MVPLSDGKLDFYPVILNGFVICFCALNLRDNPIFSPINIQGRLERRVMCSERGLH